MRANRLFPIVAAVLGGCAGAGAPTQRPDSPVTAALPPELPAVEGGWGVPVLAVAGNPPLGLWVGTHGLGLWVLREPDGEWQQVTGAGGPAPDAVVNAIAVRGDVVWYGTAGAGFGRSADRGETWQGWTPEEVGGGWAHVAPEGVAARGDTAWIATMDGLRITRDGGTRWLCIGQTGQPPASGTGCAETVQAMPSKYLLTLSVGADRRIWVGHLNGIAMSEDGGRSWRTLGPDAGVPRTRIRHVATASDTLGRAIWAATETQILVDSSGSARFTESVVRVPGWPTGLPGSPRSIVSAPGLSQTGPSILLSRGMASGTGAEAYRTYYLAASDRYAPAGDMWSMTWWGPPLWPIAGSSVGIARVLGGQVPPRVAAMREPPAALARPVDPARPWLARPIGDAANPYADAMRPFGEAMGDGAREHIAFNNPAGTPVLAVGAGEVIESGAGRLVLRLDAAAQGRTLFAVYGGVDAEAGVGARVTAGQQVAVVARATGREHDRLLLELRAALDAAAGLNGSEALNPHLWIQPMAGTGIVLGRVVDADGRPVPGAVVNGFILPYPEETPYAGLPTYAAGVAADPIHGENFAIGGIPAGEYVVGVDIDGVPVFVRAVVQAGRLTVIELAP